MKYSAVDTPLRAYLVMAAPERGNVAEVEDQLLFSFLLKEKKEAAYVILIRISFLFKVFSTPLANVTLTESCVLQ